MSAAPARPLSNTPLPPRRLDVVTIGRSSVDLYGEQIGGRLEDMASFAKYIGGCPTNIAVGTARLGLKSALVTRVGDEHMGRFIREELTREGVDVSHVRTDPTRLTALVLLGVRDKERFPLIFYRENCADAALDETDVDAELIADARAIVVTGTHFSRPNLDACSRKAMALAKAAGTRVVLDIDYRPVLWGTTGHGDGESRFVASSNVTEHILSIVGGCDVIVGTEEEFHIAGGSTDTIAALRAVRARAPQALLVCKRGPMGCSVFPDAVPDSLDEGIRGPGFPVEVYNVLGAGDAFMSGFLRGYLRDLPLTECCKLANACGAFAVSRHGCAPAVPSWTELQHFLDQGSPTRQLRLDPVLNQLHWSTTRFGDWPEVLTFAFDHRAQLEDLADRLGVDRARIAPFKHLALRAAQAVEAPGTAKGVIIDTRHGQDALDAASGSGLWIGRALELPGSIPLRFDGGLDAGSILREWPAEHCIKCLCFYHPDDPAALRDEQERQLLALQQAARTTRHELLVEIIATRSGLPVDAQTVPRALTRLYDLGLYPDWWKLVPPTEQAEWDGISAIIAERDLYCRGVVLLGLERPEEELKEAFQLAAAQAVCKGFAVGRTIFNDAAEQWLSGKIGDEAAVTLMKDNYARLIAHWNDAKAAARGRMAL